MRTLGALSAARWRYRTRFVADVGRLCTAALRDAGLRPRAVVRAVLVLITWPALLLWTLYRLLSV